MRFPGRISGRSTMLRRAPRIVTATPIAVLRPATVGFLTLLLLLCLGLRLALLPIIIRARLRLALFTIVVRAGLRFALLPIRLLARCRLALPPIGLRLRL